MQTQFVSDRDNKLVINKQKIAMADLYLYIYIFKIVNIKWGSRYDKPPVDVFASKLVIYCLCR